MAFQSVLILRSVCICCLSLQYISPEQQAYPSPAGRDAVEAYCTHLATRYQLVCQETEISQYISRPYPQIKRTVYSKQKDGGSLVRCIHIFIYNGSELCLGKCCSDGDKPMYYVTNQYIICGLGHNSSLMHKLQAFICFLVINFRFLISKTVI